MVRLLGLMLTLLASGTSWAQDTARIVAVNYPLTYFAERLVAGSAEVVYPVPEGTDPSFWRPTIADISTMQTADLVLLNGAGFAGWVDRVSLQQSRVVNTSKSVSDRYIFTDSITHSHGDGGEHSHEGVASYTWLDPLMTMAQVEAIAMALVKRGLASESDIQKRLTEVRSELASLDNAIADKESVILATHPRYQYLARAYGLNIVPLEWEAGEMPSDAQLDDLAQLRQQTNARILLWEATPPPAAIDAVSAMGLTNVIFEPLAQPPVQGDYFSSLRTSLSNLNTALSEQ